MFYLSNAQTLSQAINFVIKRDNQLFEFQFQSHISGSQCQYNLMAIPTSLQYIHLKVEDIQIDVIRFKSLTKQKNICCY